MSINIGGVIEEMNYISELSSICESVYRSNGLIVEEKKDDEENPFGKKDDEESKNEENEDESSDNRNDDTDDTEDAKETEDDPEETDNDAGGGFNGSVFDGTSDDDTSEETDDGTDDSEGNEDFGDNGTGSDEMNEGGISDEEYREASDLGVMLLMLATQVHFWHINCRSSGDHNCLGTLYNNLIDETDKLLENIVSVTKNSITAGDEQSFDFGNLEFDKEESISILEDVRGEVDKAVERYSDNQGLCNIIGNISECLGTAIYMLSRFES